MGGGSGAAYPTVAVRLVGAALMVTTALARPALRVVRVPVARQPTGRRVLAVPLLLVRAPSGMDAHMWAMVRFESPAVLGPALPTRAVAATGTPSARELGTTRLGAVAWTVSAYAWHLPPLHGLDGPGPELARSFALMAADGRVAAGLLMASAAGRCCYTHVNIGSNYCHPGSFHRYGLRDRDREASDA
ncbi:hypothetical protein [Streptomyces cylindrosporus]|uniref:Secreted protein n=1 Tax=Streptomyces cylindrosporus TaxID=2927583 RepID=A0ABS9YI36_9ACTN|nr:hypothetical protein [Streptomyces cylindrosporus]MCI3276912.1 hypothetical protein [Streptomyces cylindrosporus]